MQTFDREEFDKQLAMLCAGFDKPVGDRGEAYWKGLGKMGLIEFARCVEFALGEDGPEKIPTTQQIWLIRKRLRTPAPAIGTTQEPQDSDHIEYFANRLLLDHVRGRGGLGSTSTFVPGYGLQNCQASPELLACLKLKRDLVDFFVALVHESDPEATPKEFVKRWVRGLKVTGVVTEPTLAQYRRMAKHEMADKPFPQLMARANPKYAQLAERA